jgi:hypothetical protein
MKSNRPAPTELVAALVESRKAHGIAGPLHCVIEDLNLRDRDLDHAAPRCTDEASRRALTAIRAASMAQRKKVIAGGYGDWMD